MCKHRNCALLQTVAAVRKILLQKRQKKYSWIHSYGLKGIISHVRAFVVLKW